MKARKEWNRARLWHLFLEKWWDAKFGVLWALVSVTIGYEFMEATDIPLEYLGENTARGWAAKLGFTLWMTFMSIVRGMLVASIFIFRERHGRWPGGRILRRLRGK